MDFEVVYVATPYTHPADDVREARFQAVTEYAAELWRGGMGVYSPITQTHEAAKRGGLPTDWAFWKAQCRAMLGACTRVHILMLSGWRASVGIGAELEIAAELGLPVEYINPPAEAYCRTCPDRITGATVCTLPSEVRGNHADLQGSGVQQPHEDQTVLFGELL